MQNPAFSRAELYEHALTIRPAQLKDLWQFTICTLHDNPSGVFAADTL